MTDLSTTLREVAEIAEAHFVKTFGTNRIDSVRKAADALAAKDKLLGEAMKVLLNAGAMINGIGTVNMQTRNDAEKLKELAEWRLEAKRIEPAIRTTIANLKAAIG